LLCFHLSHRLLFIGKTLSTIKKNFFIDFISVPAQDHGQLIYPDDGLVYNIGRMASDHVLSHFVDASTKSNSLLYIMEVKIGFEVTVIHQMPLSKCNFEIDYIQNYAWDATSKRLIALVKSNDHYDFIFISISFEENKCEFLRNTTLPYMPIPVDVARIIGNRYYYMMSPYGFAPGYIDLKSGNMESLSTPTNLTLVGFSYYNSKTYGFFITTRHESEMVRGFLYVLDENDNWKLLQSYSMDNFKQCKQSKQTYLNPVKSDAWAYNQISGDMVSIIACKTDIYDVHTGYNMETTPLTIWINLKDYRMKDETSPLFVGGKFLTPIFHATVSDDIISWND